jgi:uncharacterized protein YjcR
MFPENRVERRLSAIERLLVGIAHKLDIITEVEIHDLLMENTQMATAAEVKAKIDDLLNKTQANTDATSAIASFIQGLKDQLADVQQQLADAIAAGGTPEELQAIADQLDAVTANLDADTVAEQALVNTPAEPTE